jgi:hypothetical protein
MRPAAADIDGGTGAPSDVAASPATAGRELLIPDYDAARSKLCRSP